MLLELGIKIESESVIKKSKPKLHNPYGSEGSPEHRALRDYVFGHPEIFECNPVGKFREYPLKSGDSVDVVFETSEEIIGVEVKSVRSGYDDLERGIYQCIKYKAVIVAENSIQGKTMKVKCLLLLESPLPRELRRISEKLGVKIWENFKQNRA